MGKADFLHLNNSQDCQRDLALIGLIAKNVTASIEPDEPLASPDPNAESSQESRDESRVLLLLVEDNRADVFLVEQAIEFHKVPVRLTVAEDGEAACRYFERADWDVNTPCPAIVVLDLNLPKKSGREVLDRVRKSPKCRNVPVVILTSSDSVEDRRDAARLGADRYFIKPTSYREFLEIGNVLNEVLQEQKL